MYRIEDIEIGENAPPLHPFCRSFMVDLLEDWDYETEAELEQLVDEGKGGSSEAESLHIKPAKSDVGRVNTEIVNQKIYRDRYIGLAANAKVDQSLYTEARRTLKNCNGTEYEELVAIDAKTGVVLTRNTEARMRGDIHRCGFSRKEERMLDEYDGTFECLHNHPNSSYPFTSDIAVLFRRKRQTGSTIVCHDGSVYRIAKLKQIGDIDDIVTEAYNVANRRFGDRSKSTREHEASKAAIGFLIDAKAVDFTER